MAHHLYWESIRFLPIRINSNKEREKERERRKNTYYILGGKSYYGEGGIRNKNLRIFNIKTAKINSH